MTKKAWLFRNFSRPVTNGPLVMAIRTLPCLYLPYFLLLFSNFQDGGVLNYAWAWVVCQVLCLDVAESSCNGRGPDNHGLQLPLAYLAFDVPSSPNARLDAYLTSHKTYLIRCNSSSSLHPFSHGRTGRKMLRGKCLRIWRQCRRCWFVPNGDPTARRDPDVLGWA